MTVGGKRLFALDQNFPEPTLVALQDAIEEAELVPLRRIDPRLTGSKMPDWQIIHALHMHPRPWDGLVTTDRSMLSLPRELSVLCQTKLTLVVPVSAGHDPLRATGLLLTHLPYICQQTNPTVPQIWELSAKQRPAGKPWDLLRGIADRGEMETKALYDAHRLSVEDFAADPLADTEEAD